MKKAFLAGLILSFYLHSFSQSVEEPAQKPVQVNWSGFILNQLYFDSRKNLDAVDGQVVLFPLPKDMSADGEDLNGVPNLNLLSLASRIRSAISGPDVFGATSSGLIEIDFTSRASSATVRFRQAWVKLTWKNTELLTGRTWHPLSSTDVSPIVNALNWGAPFQPFNRSDQIMLTRYMGKLSLTGSLIFQNDYTTNGPAGKSFLYQTNSLHPELNLQVKYRSEGLILGAGADYKKILPRTQTTSPSTGLKYSTNESFSSLAFIGYAQIKTGKLTVASKSIYATNISENLMAGGFGISSLDSVTGRETYAPYKHWYIWGNVMYGNIWKAGVFGGYFRNLGATENLAAGTAVYGLGEKIAYMYRITPVISYTSGRATLAAEVECNTAAYGTIDHADKGKIINTDEVTGVRVLFSLLWTF